MTAPETDTKLIEFAKDVIRQSWDGSLDEPYVQELGVKLGLLKQVVFDPAIHSDVNAYAEVGDPWYVFDGPLSARAHSPAATVRPKELTNELRKAFREAEAEDVLTRIMAWGLLENAGLAESFLVGGQFFKLSLTDEGRRLRDEFSKESQT